MVKPRFKVRDNPAKYYKPGSWAVDDIKDFCAVSIHPTKEEAEAECDRLNAERETRLMHGRRT